MNNFQWMVECEDALKYPDFLITEQWLGEVAKDYGKIIGDLNYVFCDDDKILRVNREFLNHDYYTDIITFDRSTRGVVRGDIYISVDTVKSNAESLRQNVEREMNRVIVHGLLHLCGINDKGPGEREIMERAEDKALALLEKMI